MKDRMLESALAYATKFNWSVFPLRPKGKEPLTEHGLLDATMDTETIRTWWEKWPNANIGIACGPSKLVVIDIDGDRGGEETWHDLGIGDDTIVSLTGGGGRHLFYAAPDDVDIRNSSGKLGPGVDVRANGGYVVAPPSIHPNGREYAWEVSAHPGDRGITLPTETLRTSLVKDNRRVAPKLPNVITEGQRNAALASLAGSMRRRGASEAAILAALVEENNRCDPPLGQRELESIAKSVARYEPEPSRAEVQKMDVADLFVEKTFIPPRLGRHILAQVPLLNLTKEKTTGHLHSYHNGVYLRDGAARVAEMAGAILGDKYRDNRAEETTRWLEMKTRVDPETANWRGGLINVKNGMLNWQTGELSSHNSTHLSTIQIPVDYDPEAKCPKIEEFLLTTLPGDCIEMALEWIGYTLIPTTRYQKVLITVGPGANGKSTFLDLIKTFLGKRNVSGIPLQELSEHRFKRAELQGKLVNMFADLSAASLKSSSYFKMIVTGDEIDAERKYGHPFTFEPFSRLIFSANKMPSSYDRSKAFYRRWLIVPFPNCFEGDEADTDILAKMTTPQELSGLLNLAIRYLRELTARGYFDEPETVATAMAEYRKTSDPMAAFLDECCYTSDTELLEVGRTLLYNTYKDYCEDAKAYTEPRADFYTRMREMYPGLREERLRRGDKKVGLFIGGPALLAK